MERCLSSLCGENLKIYVVKEKPGSPATVFKGFLLASHFGPTVLVVTISFILAATQYSVKSSLQIAGAIMAGQFFVGWSNDLIDHPLDLAASRKKKPLVAGSISPRALKRGIFLALISALVLSLAGPLGLKGSAIHGIGLASATLYNLKLKQTFFSILPYMISFGAMPWAIYASEGKSPTLWLCLGFILFASAFHFLNVVKDLEWDLKQGINGLPQRLGRKRSIFIATTLAIAGILLVIFKWSQLSPA
jgi:4-hydroxybenzoate polyprenyltransferase